MSIGKKIYKFIFMPNMRKTWLLNLRLSQVLPDRLFLYLKFKYSLGYKLDLIHPRTYNEKIQWLKLNDRKTQYISMVDKYEVKKLVSSIVGSQYIIPTLGVWSSVDTIDTSILPNQFVLKCTHDSGSAIICTDLKSFNEKHAKKVLNKSLNRNYYYLGREWPYKRIKPRVIAEPFLEDSNTGELRDYKFFCFDGEPQIMFIAANRQSVDRETTFDFYDMNFNHLDIINGHPNSSTELEKPKSFDLMKDLAKKLSNGIPHVRIDFYEVNGRVYFGEYTFYHFSGFTPFEPKEWDYILGDMINLPNK